MVNGIYEAAQNYLSKGWSVIPIKKGEKFPCISWEEYQNRLATQEELKEWFNDTDNQLGIITGRVSGGLFIMDFDGEGWQESYSKFVEAFPEFDNTVYVKTGSDRAHLWAICSDLPLTITKMIKDCGNGNHIELRANNHQTLVPPSIHPSGNAYSFKGGIKDPIVIPPQRFMDIIHWMGETEKPTEEKIQKQGLLPDLMANGIPEGVRNDTLMREAARLIGKGLTKDEILPTLLTFNNNNCNPPLEEKEVETILNSMWEKDKRNHPQDEKTYTLEIQGYTITAMEEVYTMEEVQRNWVWEGILPAGGMSLIVAKPKVGKSILAQNIAANVARGKPFLGRNTTQGKVLVLALEESLQEVKKRFKEAYPEPLKDFYWHFGSAPTKDALGKLAAVMQEMKPVLVVIDIMQKFIRVKEGSYEEAISKLEPVMDIARKLNCHITLTHHAGKTDKELIDMVLGSTGYAASVDTVIIIKETKPIRVMSTVQRYHEKGIPDVDGEVLLLGKDEFTLTSGGNKELMDRETAKERILQVLGQIGPGNFYTESLTYNQIAEAIHKSKNYTMELVKELFAEGKIKRTGTGKTGRNGDPFRYSV